MNVKKCVRALLCLYLTLIIAMDAVKAQALKVGDTLPPELWSMPLDIINHPEGKDYITLADYKDKLIILDFWATWCAPCIKSLAKLDTLQKEFGKQLAVIPITYEAGGKALVMFQKRGWKLPTVVNDTLVKHYFPHRSIPHQIWVQEGKVLAITGAEYATRENISQILQEESVVMKTKSEDMDFDASKPLYLNKEKTLYNSSIGGKQNVRSAGVSRRGDGIVVYNLRLLGLVREAFARQIPFYGRKNRIQYDSNVLNDNSPALKDSLYTYSLNLPSHTTLENIYQHFKYDVSNFIELSFGLKAEVMTVNKPCMVLTIENLDLAKTQGGPHTYQNLDNKIVLNNSKATTLEYFLANVHYESPYPLVSTIPKETYIDVVLEGDLANMKNLSEQLVKHGLSLSVKDYPVDILLISKK